MDLKIYIMMEIYGNSCTFIEISIGIYIYGEVSMETFYNFMEIWKWILIAFQLCGFSECVTFLFLELYWVVQYFKIHAVLIIESSLDIHRMSVCF